MSLSKETIESLKSANGNSPLMAVGELCVFKRPTRAEYDRWANAKVAGNDPTLNTRQLAQACLVYPKWDEFIQLLDERPSMLLNECADAMIELAGVGGENTKLEVKKL